METMSWLGLEGGRPPRVDGLAGLSHRRPSPREGPTKRDTEHSHPRRCGM